MPRNTELPFASVNPFTVPCAVKAVGAVVLEFSHLYTGAPATRRANARAMQMLCPRRIGENMTAEVFNYCQANQEELARGRQDSILLLLPSYILYEGINPPVSIEGEN